MIPPPLTVQRSHGPRPMADLPLSPLARTSGSQWWTRVRTVLDALVLALATAAAVFGSDASHFRPAAKAIAAGFPILVLILLKARRDPDDRLSQSGLDVVWHVVSVLSLAAMVEVALNSLFGTPHSLVLPLRLWVFGLVYMGVARIVLRSLRRRAFSFEAFAAPTLIVGAGVVGQQLTHRLLTDRTYGLRPVGLIDADPLPASPHRGASGVPVLGGLDDLPQAIAATGAQQLILAFSSDPDRLMLEKVEVCRRLGVSVLLVPRFYELMNDRATLDHLGGVPVVALRSIDPLGWQFTVKHALDRAFAAIALLALSPLLLAIALLVRVSSPGPSLFRQRRIGRDGREFDLLKFRTMRAGPEPTLFELKAGMAPGGVEGIDRRTRVGRFLRATSLDELPQLLNVLRGEMSIVGPRPERPAFVERFVAEVDRYDRRHRVKAGITGWAQVLGLRGQTSITDRVEWDNFYIQNWSLWLDLKILALTLAEVFRFRG
jgi:exopolysaccharide biosynthesis polyprenyl glycosylphosphotransferase